MKSLAKIILSAYTSVAPSLQNLALAEPETAKKAEIAQATQTEIKPASLEISPSAQVPIEQKPLYEVTTETKYSVILDECKRTNADSVTRTRKVSRGLEKSIAKHGFEAVAKVKNDLDKSCLDLIVKKINNEISEENIKKEIEKLAKEYQENLQKTNVNSPINFTNEKMIKAQQEKINIDIEFYEHLLRANPRINSETGVDYNSLVTASFSQQEYEKIISQQLDALNGVYDAMNCSGVGFKGLFISKEVNALRKARKKELEEAKKNYTTPAKEINKEIKNK